jgi:putative transposase
VLDLFSRRVLSWRLSIILGFDPRMEAAFCIETLEDALARHGKTEIFNTDQGSQFTGAAFIGVLIENGIAISMDGKGAWRDNVFVERQWRSVTYEEVYLRARHRRRGARIDRALPRLLQAGRIRALTAPPPITLTQPAATPRGSLTRQTLHLSTRKCCSGNRGRLRLHRIKTAIVGSWAIERRYVGS